MLLTGETFCFCWLLELPRHCLNKKTHVYEQTLEHRIDLQQWNITSYLSNLSNGLVCYFIVFVAAIIYNITNIWSLSSAENLQNESMSVHFQLTALLDLVNCWFLLHFLPVFSFCMPKIKSAHTTRLWASVWWFKACLLGIGSRCKKGVSTTIVLFWESRNQIYVRQLFCLANLTY